jgi:hypothetical protein
VPLCNLLEGPRPPACEFWAALEPVVREVLSRAGYPVRAGGRPLPELPAPDLAGLGRLGFADAVLLDAVRRHEQAVVRYGPAVDVSRLLAQVALAWPSATLAVVTRRTDEARALRDRLRRLGVEAVAVTGRRTPAEVGRVAVGTPAGMAHTPVQFEWRTIVVAVDGVEATGKDYLLALRFAPRARLFGLLPADARPSPLERDLMTSFFGFAEVVVPRHGHRERPVQVVSYPITGGPTLPAALGGVALNRAGMWHHHLRNRVVARVARAFFTGDADAVRRLFGPGVTAAGAPGVAVLVDNVEQALGVARRLPDWDVFTGPEVHEGGLGAGRRRVLHRPLDPLSAAPLHAVVTAAACPTLYLAGVDVLVRADGGLGLPPLTAEQLSEPDDAPARPLLVVDFLDRHHPALRRRSRRRRQAYDARGWFAPGVDPVAARVDEFLETRRQGRWA